MILIFKYFFARVRIFFLLMGRYSFCMSSILRYFLLTVVFLFIINDPLWSYFLLLPF